MKTNEEMNNFWSTIYLQHLTDLFHTVFEHIAHQVNSATYIYQQLFFFLGADGALNVP